MFQSYEAGDDNGYGYDRYRYGNMQQSKKVGHIYSQDMPIQKLFYNF